MTLSAVPRRHYLHIHDALRKVLGTDAKLSAFVTKKQPFQCDMLVNSSRTDPLTLSTSPGHLERITEELQEELGNCTVTAHAQRVEVGFPDRQSLCVALGASVRDMDGVMEPRDINREPDFRKRNRLRISLGFDEDLFTSQLTVSLALASRMLERWSYDQVMNSPILSVDQEMRKAYEASGNDWRAVTPPLTYWQAHGYALGRVYPCNHFQDIQGTVLNNFARYYGEYPMDNPYCQGEDLNTTDVARWICRAWKQMPMEETEIQLAGANNTTGTDDECSEGEGRS